MRERTTWNRTQIRQAAVNKKARHKRIVSRPEVQKQTRVVTTRDDVGAALDALLG